MNSLRFIAFEAKSKHEFMANLIRYLLTFQGPCSINLRANTDWLFYRYNSPFLLLNFSTPKPIENSNDFRMLKPDGKVLSSAINSQFAFF